VITSPSGAAVRDVLSVLGRRFPLLEVDVLPVQVQGETAAAQIAAMLKRAGASGRYDAILLTRGGGSLEDLWAFNDEQLARAIAASPVPVVSAVGHETDFSLADFAADLRAPTPSVAAELLVPNRSDLSTRLQGLQRRLSALQLQSLRQSMQRADRAVLRLQAMRPQARLQLLQRRRLEAQRRLESAWREQLERRHASLRHAAAVLRSNQPQRRVAGLQELAASLSQRAQAATARALQGKTLELRGLARSLETVSPLATIARGYSILQDDTGRIVRSVHDATAGERLSARLQDGVLKVRVEESDD
jgi:exodeoxyribonuclease VII large subunit